MNLIPGLQSSAGQVWNLLVHVIIVMYLSQATEWYELKQRKQGDELHLVFFVSVKIYLYWVDCEQL
jgi:hypothetical protein